MSSYKDEKYHKHVLLRPLKQCSMPAYLMQLNRLKSSDQIQHSSEENSSSLIESPEYKMNTELNNRSFHFSQLGGEDQIEEEFSSSGFELNIRSQSPNSRCPNIKTPKKLIIKIRTDLFKNGKFKKPGQLRHRLNLFGDEQPNSCCKPSPKKDKIFSERETHEVLNLNNNDLKIELSSRLLKGSRSDLIKLKTCKDATNSLFLNNAQASQNSSNSPKIYTKEMIMEMIKKRKDSLCV